MSYNLIVTAASNPSKSKMSPPYWIDRHPNGNLMIFEAINGLNLEVFDKIYITILLEHQNTYQILEKLKWQFSKYNLQDKLKVVVLGQPTSNQPETINLTIEQADIKGGIMIKDADNHFSCTPYPDNFVSTFPLDELDLVNPSGKSYISLDDSSFITNIIEKKIISRWFCSGGYGFKEAQQFQTYYNQLKTQKPLYVSHIVYAMLLDGFNFRPIPVSNYLDWGTEGEWLAHKKTYGTLVIPFSLLYEDSEICRRIKDLHQTGKKGFIILVDKAFSGTEVLSPSEYLKQHDIPYNYLIEDLIGEELTFIKTKQKLINFNFL